MNRLLLFSSDVSQQFWYFHKSFLNKVQIRKDSLIKSEDKALKFYSECEHTHAVDLQPYEKILAFSHNHFGSWIRLGSSSS